MDTALIEGNTVVGNVVNLGAAGAANAVAIFQVSNFAQQIGTKSFIPRKIMIRNNANGATWINLGTGVAGAFAAQYPPIRTQNNIDAEWQEVELPSREFFVDMTAYPDAFAGGGIDIVVEAEEIG